MNPLYPATAKRAENRCEYCCAPQDAFNALLEVEHIVPHKAGGSDDSENLALSCSVCNRFKAARQQAVDPETGQRVPLFAPRRQVWEEHFEWSEDFLLIHGRTPEGRATVAALKMNSALQQTARGFWIVAKLFP